jgi:hypothetical protein
VIVHAKRAWSTDIETERIVANSSRARRSVDERILEVFNEETPHATKTGWRIGKT